MRKIHIAALVLVSCFVSAAPAQTYVGVLNGANEFPGPGDPDGFGLAGFRLEGTTVAYSIMIQHVSSANASHIHRGAAGVSGRRPMQIGDDPAGNLDMSHHAPHQPRRRGR